MISLLPLLLCLQLFMPSGANYILDDSNVNITYSPEGKWHHQNSSFTADVNINHTYLYNGTFSNSWYCTASDNCTISIPFTGSGITLFNVIYWSISANVTLDGKPTTSFLHFNCNRTCYNASTVDLPFLADGEHTLEVVLTEFDHADNDTGAFYLDYVEIHTTDTNRIPEPAPSGNSRSDRKNVQVGIIVGCVFGVVAIILIAWVGIKRSSRYTSVPTENGDKIPHLPRPRYTRLSQDRVVTITDLLRRGVPVHIVARVMEDMINEEANLGTDVEIPFRDPMEA